MARLFAFAIDYILIALYLAILATAVLALGLHRGALAELAADPVRMDLLAFATAVLPVVLYFTLLEGSGTGATLGKRLQGIRVVRADGAGAGRWRALARSAVKFLPWQLAHTSLLHIPGWPMQPAEPPAWVVAGLVVVWLMVIAYAVSIFLHPARRTPYDLLSGTVVIKAK